MIEMHMTIFIILASVGFIAIIACSCLLWLNCQNRRPQSFYLINRDNNIETGVNSVSSYAPLLDKSTISINFNPENIQLGEKLGTGSFAVVYKATWRKMGECAVKELHNLHPDALLIKRFQQEMQTMKKLASPFIVQFYGNGVKHGNPFIVMELMEGGSLAEFLHNPAERILWERRLTFAKNIAAGLRYLHHCDPVIIHRDLNSKNILLTADKQHAKLADFGLAKILNEAPSAFSQNFKDSLGAISWCAPEVIKNKVYSIKSDIYSYGVVLWELTSRRIPYQNVETAADIIKKLMEDQRDEIPLHTPAKFAELIKWCWQKNADQRPSTSEISRILNDETLQKQINNADYLTLK